MSTNPKPLSSSAIESLINSLNNARRESIEDQHAQVDLAILAGLKDSDRIIRMGRAVQRRRDCRLVEAMILELHKKGPNDLNAVLMIDKLNILRDQITGDSD